MSRAFVALGLALACGPACGRPPDPPAHPEKDVGVIREEHTPDKLVARGRAFQQLGDLVRAEEYFAAALKAGADPKDVLPLLMHYSALASVERCWRYSCAWVAVSLPRRQMSGRTWSVKWKQAFLRTIREIQL